MSPSPGPSQRGNIYNLFICIYNLLYILFIFIYTHIYPDRVLDLIPNYLAKSISDCGIGLSDFVLYIKAYQ